MSLCLVAEDVETMPSLFAEFFREIERRAVRPAVAKRVIGIAPQLILPAERPVVRTRAAVTRREIAERWDGLS